VQLDVNKIDRVAVVGNDVFVFLDLFVVVLVVPDLGCELVVAVFSFRPAKKVFLT